MGRNVPPGFPRSHLPASQHEKSPTLWSARPRRRTVSRVSASYSSSILWSPHGVLQSVVEARPMCPRARENMQIHRVSEGSPARQREGEREASLFPSNYISLGLRCTGCVFKRTNQLPKFYWLLKGPHPLVGLTCLYGQAHPL